MNIADILLVAVFAVHDGICALLDVLGLDPERWWNAWRH